ncbi:hypothetical protein CPB83DRAFT_851292 [Crepidotus variabilis]|uniref:Uncharacterized protein n=1 Tax=Crepidotus variabilis TaxID=179855 RepID=A0A9P6EK25_9AGAR|nr:hypothetical protein CPB83DRAFT_851292 [Crepidotus variabilis]
MTFGKRRLMKLGELIAEYSTWAPFANKSGFSHRLTSQFEKIPFSNARYELVVLHPRHFLPLGSSMPFLPTRVEAKYYVTAADGNAWPSRQSSTPSFSFDAKSHSTLFLLFCAEMAFRRFKRIQLPELCQDYERLINLTTELVELIYQKPICPFDDPSVDDSLSYAHTRSRDDDI